MQLVPIGHTECMNLLVCCTVTSSKRGGKNCCLNHSRANVLHLSAGGQTGTKGKVMVPLRWREGKKNKKIEKKKTTVLLSGGSCWTGARCKATFIEMMKRYSL